MPAGEAREATERTGGRSARVRAAIIEATTAELLEVGFADLTLSAVATRAGVALSTVRRRYANTAELVGETLREVTAELVETPDLGSLESDLRAFGAAVVAYQRDPRTHALLRATLALPERELSMVRAETWRTRARVAQGILRRSLERGEIPPQRDLGRIVEMLIAPIWARQFLTGQPVTDADVEGFVADALAAARGAQPPWAPTIFGRVPDVST